MLGYISFCAKDTKSMVGELMSMVNGSARCNGLVVSGAMMSCAMHVDLYSYPVVDRYLW